MEKKTIKRSDWISSFGLIGRAKVGEFTFKINEKSEKSSFIYNSLNLAVECGEKYGTIYCEAMGGYSESNDTKIYAHGKKSDGTDDFDKRIIVDWDDRMNEDILDTIGDLSFITVGLEKTNKGKTFYKKFLSWYDAIEYVNEHLEDGTIVNVQGSLKYQEYNGNVQCRKQINSIVLSSKTEESDFKATFRQSILIDKDCIDMSPSGVDKDRGILFIDARVLDYVSSYNGVDVKGQFPFRKQFEYMADFSNMDDLKKKINLLFKVKKDITQISFEGMFSESHESVQLSLDDLPSDIRDLVDAGIYTEKEALEKCSARGSSVQRMLLLKPVIKLVSSGEDKEEKTPVIQKFEKRYTEDDLYLDYVFDKDEEDEVDDDSSAEEVDSWLSGL
jgi:hypothetical protein